MSWRRSEALKRKKSGSDKLAFLPLHLQHSITARVCSMCTNATLWTDCHMKRSFSLCLPTLEHHLVTRQQNLLSVGSLSILQYSWLVWVWVGHGESLQALHTLWTSTGELQRAIGWNRNCKGANKTVTKRIMNRAEDKSFFKCDFMQLYSSWYWNLPFTIHYENQVCMGIFKKLQGFCVICVVNQLHNHFLHFCCKICGKLPHDAFNPSQNPSVKIACWLGLLYWPVLVW